MNKEEKNSTIVNNSKGITLIALVVTIIILLILATVTVTGVIRDKLFDKAGEAVRKTDLITIMQDLEEIKILDNNPNLTGSMQEIFENKYQKYNDVFKVENGKLVYIGTNETVISDMLDLGATEDQIENKVHLCNTLGHNWKEANYLTPKICLRCGLIEGTALVATSPHPDQQLTEDIGIGTDGELVNLDLWYYVLENDYYNLYKSNTETAYLGTLENGKIQGTVPQKIGKKKEDETIEFKEVQSLYNTFYNCTELEIAPEIPETVTNMQYTFMNCTSLTKTPVLPKNLVYLHSTFRNCTSLIEPPEIPNSVTEMRYTFYGCKNLKITPEIPNSVRIMPGTFGLCENLTETPIIPSGVTDITGIFNGCKLLTEAPTIPSGVTNLSFAFTNCKSLTEAPIIPNGVTNMYQTFNYCTSLTEAPVIPNSVTNLDYAFANCYSLTQAPEIPDGVTNMSSTFANCTSLTQAPVIPENVTNINRTFYGCTNLQGTLTINATNIADYESCLRNATTAEGITLVVTGSAPAETLQAIVTEANNSNITYQAPTTP